MFELGLSILSINIEFIVPIFDTETPKDIKELADTYNNFPVRSSFQQTFSNTQRLFYLKSAIDPWLIIPLFIYLLM